MPGSAGKDTSSTNRELEQHPPKRRRISYACDHCRAKKNRCDGERPTCSPCRTRKLECVYAVQKPRSIVTQEYVDNLKSRNRLLEQQLAAYNGSARIPSISSYSSSNEYSSASRPSLGPGSDVRSEFVQPSAVPRPFHAPIPSPAQSSFSTSLTYQAQLEHGSPGNPIRESINNVVQLDGSTSSTSQSARRNGFKKPADQASLADGAESSAEYFGETSTFDFMTKVSSPPEEDSKQHSAALRRQGTGSVDASLAMASPSEPIFEGLVMGPGLDDPFGFPNRSVADKLVNAYFTFRHPQSPYIHEPTFRKRYERLWISEDQGGENASQTNLAWFGLVNLVFTFGSAFPQSGSRASGDRFRFFKRARTLVFSGLLQASSIDHVQALLLIGQYLHTSLELNTCWTVVGLAIRTAQGLGLHLDASSFTSDLVEQEVRRRVWWGCFIMDRILGMKIGRPPTIHDGPNIEVGLPLAVDDEYLTNDESKPPVQPAGVPSKLDFLIQVVPQCRLLERICDTLYSRHRTDNSKQKLEGLPKLLSKAIELDGDLVAWQEALPAHLKPDSEDSGWCFERQRSTLIMRFLNSRLLLHRQILLLYVTRRITDTFQRDIMYCCVQRCILAAYETINQMRILRQRQLIHNWWHNSHYVFAALGVMLTFQTLDERGKQDVHLPESVDVDQIISQGYELLEEVGGQMHPIAARYRDSLRRMEAKLKTVSAGRAKFLERGPLPTTLPAEEQGRAEYSTNSFPASTDGDYGDSFQQMGQIPVGFGDDFEEIENLFYSTGWYGQGNEWNEMAQ